MLFDFISPIHIVLDLIFMRRDKIMYNLESTSITKVFIYIVVILGLAHFMTLQVNVFAGDNEDLVLIQKLGNDDSMYRKCLSDLGSKGLSKHLEIKRISVKIRGESLIIITPLDSSPSQNCFLWGAHEPMTAVYRQIGSRYYQLMESAAYGEISIMKTYSNGYPDLQTSYPIHAGRSISKNLYSFNGKKYVLKKEITQRVRR
jgi:hypothetical protein